VSDPNAHTDPGTPFLVRLDRGLKEIESKFNTIEDKIDGMEGRIMAAVVNAICPRLSRVEVVQSAQEHRVQQVEMRTLNVEEGVAVGRVELTALSREVNALRERFDSLWRELDALRRRFDELRTPGTGETGQG